MIDPSAPTPSVETILHALLPYPFVDHTHADALLAVTNTADGRAARTRDLRRRGGRGAVRDARLRPGASASPSDSRSSRRRTRSGMVLLNHGFFTFRPDGARVVRADDRAGHAGGGVPGGARRVGRRRRREHRPATVTRIETVALRRQVSDVAGVPMILATHAGPKELAFAQRPDLEDVSQQGPVTPDHVIRTKRVPQIGRDVAAYSAAYERTSRQHATPARLTMLDPAPRVILDPRAGRDHHRPHRAGRGHRLRRLRPHDRRRPARDGAGRLSGAAGRGHLRRRVLGPGAGQAAARRQRAIVRWRGRAGHGRGVGHRQSLRRGAPASAARRWLVSTSIRAFARFSASAPTFSAWSATSAGQKPSTAPWMRPSRRSAGWTCWCSTRASFPSSQRIDALPLSDWRRVMDINLDANLALLSAALSAAQVRAEGGRVVVIGSKNVPAPGPGAAAYSASKAAVNQLARVAALEWGGDGIRVNIVHPNAVFDTGIWTEDVLRSRAANYGLSVERVPQEQRAEGGSHQPRRGRDGGRDVRPRLFEDDRGAGAGRRGQ